MTTQHLTASDLMVGDWVMYGDKPVQVLQTTNDKVYKGFSPIPLTQEILEKNGFYYGNTASEEDFCNAVGCSYPEDGWCYDEGAGEIKILFPTESDGGLIRLDDQSADRHLEWFFVEPIMLHELQHALKLCGINKEIIL